MNYAEALKMLKACGQEHVLADYKKLSKAQQKALLAQIATIEPKALARCQAALAAKSELFDSSKGVAPKVATLSGRRLAAAQRAGEAEIAAGRVGVLLVAGGQGSRLGFEGPKGCYPIGPITDKPLFYFHARKILALALRYETRIPFYIMTSETNDAATRQCFAENDYFGLPPEDVFFFVQGMWPGMTPEGKIFVDAPGHIFMSPDGHGGTLAALQRSGALADMKKRGITSIFYFQVDNPLIEIADPAFIGYHVQQRSQYSLKLCPKRDPYEKVGMPMQFGRKARMIEYTEMSKEQCERRDAAGELYFRYGSPAIHVFDREFLEREADRDMPLHLAFKKIPYVVGGKKVKPDAPNGYKFEKLIFDILPNARRTAYLAFDAADEFAPVKNAEGADSPATCKAALAAKWRRKLAAAGLTVAPEIPLELDPVCELAAADMREAGFNFALD